MKDREELEQVLERLEEDAALMEMALLGLQAALDRISLQGLLRVNDGVKAHLRELEGYLSAVL